MDEGCGSVGWLVSLLCIGKSPSVLYMETCNFESMNAEFQYFEFRRQVELERVGGMNQRLYVRSGEEETLV